jgi:hypothetical protein
MHYNRFAFAKQPKSVTIVAKDEQFQNVIGQRLRMSPIDIMLVEKLYSHSAKHAYSHSNKDGRDLIMVILAADGDEQ